MKCDIILAGVGGQGVLALAAIIASAAASEGLLVRQSEVHGMAQRGGSVQAHLRLSDQAIHSGLIPRGRADLILAMEPLEALRHIDFLAPAGGVVSATETVRNIPDYPDPSAIHQGIARVGRQRLVDTLALARQAGGARTANLVLVGAAADWLPVSLDALRHSISLLFAGKGEEVLARNLAAFELARR